MKRGKSPKDGVPGRPYPFPVEITPADYEQMIIYSRLARPHEVGGVALVEDTGETLRIHSPTLLTQTVSHGDVDLAADEVLDWMLNNFPPGDVNRKLPNITFCFWHSHVDMKTFFSSQDERWINNYVNRGYLVSLCVNVRREHDIRVDTLVGGTDQSNALWFHGDAVLEFTYEIDHDKLSAACKREFAAKVTAKSYPKYSKGKKGKRYGGAYRGPQGYHGAGHIHGFPPIDNPAPRTYIDNGHGILVCDQEGMDLTGTPLDDTPPSTALDRTLAVDPDGKITVSVGENAIQELDPCEFREFLSDFPDDPETDMLLKSLRANEVATLRKIRDDFKHSKAKTDVVFNTTGSLTVRMGKHTRTVTPTAAAIKLVCERFGVADEWVKQQISSGNRIRTTKYNNSGVPIISITRPTGDGNAKRQ